MAQNKSFIDKEAISCALGGMDVRLYPVTDSTNTQAKQLIKDGKDAPFLLIANEQTDGRGRHGRSFYSPADTGIYMSLALSFEKEKTASQITVAASVAVCKALESLTEKKLGIKWVNDIYLGGKKICGILCESVFCGEKNAPVIIGVGINLTTEEFPKELTMAGSLFGGVSKESLVCETVKELIKATGSELDLLLPYYRSRSLILGKEITFINDGVSQKGTAIDIDGSGGLVIFTDGGTVTLNSSFSILDY